MSLKNLNSNKEFELDRNIIVDEVNDPVFFFIYNTDNYYHFIYDTLPYLITYNHLKSDISNLKLLMNYQEFHLYFFNSLKQNF